VKTPSSLHLTLTLFGLFTAAAQLAHAGIIINVDGPDNAGTAVTNLNQTVAGGATFSTSVAYQNVNIFLSFISFSTASEMDLQVFLTDQIGAGTTAILNEKASATPHISMPASPVQPPYTITQFLVLSGLTLPAGTYDLTFRGTNFTGGNGYEVLSSDSDVVVVTNGASIGAPNLFSGSPDPYVPASAFANQSPFNLWFEVTGDVAPIPEPATVVAALGGILLLIGLRRRTCRC
jgi:hypothetical protein